MKNQFLLATLVCSMPIVALAQEANEPLDLTKRRIEVPTERLVESNPTEANAAAGQPEPAPPPAAPRAVADRGPDWPEVKIVEPGKVQWHADFETARAAGKASGKPVLLFQLLGKLDEHFT